MRPRLILAGISLVAVPMPALACQTLTPEGVRHYQDAEVDGVVTVTGPTSAVLVPKTIRRGPHRERFEIAWTPRETPDGLAAFLMICNEWAPTAPEVRGRFHLQRKSPGGPYVVLPAELDDEE